MSGFMVSEVWCDLCPTKAYGDGTLRDLRADLRYDGWVRRRTRTDVDAVDLTVGDLTLGKLIDVCSRCVDED